MVLSQNYVSKKNYPDVFPQLIVIFMQKKKYCNLILHFKGWKEGKRGCFELDFRLM